MKHLERFAIWYLRKLIAMSRIMLDRLLAHQAETPHPKLEIWRNPDDVSYSGPERRKRDRRGAVKRCRGAQWS